jgi:hypothetical protein
MYNCPLSWKCNSDLMPLFGWIKPGVAQVCTGQRMGEVKLLDDPPFILVFLQ